MKIQNINKTNSNPASFQKSKVMSYNTIDKHTGNNASMSLYKLDRSDAMDTYEVQSSNYPLYIKKDFFYNPHCTIYTLENDENKTPMAFAETTLHQTHPKEMVQEKYLAMSIYKTDYSYKKLEAPFYAQAIKEAQEANCDSVHFINKDKTNEIVAKKDEDSSVVSQKNFRKSMTKLKKRNRLDFNV